MRNLQKSLVFTIEYIVDPDYVNIEETLDRLRENGEANVIDVAIRDDSVAREL